MYGRHIGLLKYNLLIIEQHFLEDVFQELMSQELIKGHLAFPPLVVLGELLLPHLGQVAVLKKEN